ncbi:MULTISPECIES: ATP-grasp domain-containing protein [Yersinia]|uniref:ATP-grasp domain-containing protein n=1 Tax=Yersinia TaxID=629 RepID=UPI0005E372BE|nr:ATP-grasp domain-containing protein [Yersinia pseudotuberculosis]CND59459.1 Uncharacterised protein [Yersinia pseudotuberculosis]
MFYLQMVGGHQLQREEALVAQYLNAIGKPFTKCSLSQIQRARVAIDNAVLIVGNVSFMKAALRQLSLELPNIETYPDCLLDYLGRQVWQGTLAELDSYLKMYPEGIFIKPSLRTKRFTGFVTEFSDDARLYGISKREPVWYSQPVNWISEWRVYVVDNQVRYIALCEGDRAAVPEQRVIGSAVQMVANSATLPRSYAIDFGITDSGDTTLIEMNDGLAIGAYDSISPEIYFNLLLSRWQELTSI